MNHAAREAAARCPTCKEFFCRECITEHKGRLTCTACLQKIDRQETEKKDGAFRNAGKVVVGGLKALLSLMMLWMLFYGIGQLLLLFPDSFHSGNMWKDL